MKPELGEAAADAWQIALDDAREGVGVLDAEGRVIRENRAFRALLGLGDAGSDARPFVDRVSVEASVLVRDLVEGRRQAVEIAFETRTVALRCDLRSDGRGAVLFVSEMAPRGRSLPPGEAIQIQKDELLAMLAHELRNPLNAISTSLHLQSIYGAQDERNQRLRATVNRQTAHLTRLVDDMLEVSQLTRGTVVLRRDTIDLTRAVEGAIEASRGRIEARKQTLITSLAAEPVWINGDAMRLEQAIGKLLDNAAKFSEPERRIWISLAVEAGAAVVRVRDEGCGIAPEMQAAIFELFRQGEQALDRPTGGLGIGLTVVRSLAEMHGGTVTVTSEGRGSGAEFKMQIPLGTPESDAPPRKNGAMRVLVVEDNLEVLEMIEMALQIAGYGVETASDGVTGLELLLATRPDVALVDVGLPGLDGYRFAERVRAEPACGGVYLVAVTGYGRAEDRARALRAGFDAHLVKPIRTAQILALLKDAERVATAEPPKEGT